VPIGERHVSVVLLDHLGVVYLAVRDVLGKKKLARRCLEANAEDFVAPPGNILKLLELNKILTVGIFRGCVAAKSVHGSARSFERSD